MAQRCTNSDSESVVETARVLGRRRRHYLEWCLDDVKASELKEGKRKASPKYGFASYDRYALVSRSGSRYTLATHHRSGYTQNATRKFIRSQPLSDAAADVVAPTAGKKETHPAFLLILFFSAAPRPGVRVPRKMRAESRITCGSIPARRSIIRRGEARIHCFLARTGRCTCAFEIVVLNVFHTIQINDVLPSRTPRDVSRLIRRWKRALCMSRARFCRVISVHLRMWPNVCNNFPVFCRILSNF